MSSRRGSDLSRRAGAAPKEVANGAILVSGHDAALALHQRRLHARMHGHLATENVFAVWL